MRLEINVELYNFLKKYAIPKNGLCGVELESITHLPYVMVKSEIPDLFKEEKFDEAIHKILISKKRIKFTKVLRQSVEDKLLFIFWIQEQYEKLNQLEQNYLASPPDPKLIRAGVQDLDELGIINIIDNLAQGDILRWSQVEQMPYEVVFTKLRKSAIESRIAKRMRENMK